MSSIARSLNEYFEPPSRMQVSAKLRHLLRFSDFVLLITGDSGTGRTTLIEQITPRSDGNQRWTLLRFDQTVDVTRLLVSLTEALGIASGPKPDNRARLRALHEFAKSLRELEQPLLLFIDDADYLTNNALELLINFALIEDAAPRLVLTGTPAFEQRFHGSQLDQLLEGRLHVQLLEPFEPEEADAFVDTLLPATATLSSRQRQTLIENAEGLPGRLHAGLFDLIRDGGVRRSGARLMPFPAGYTFGVGAILAAILGMSVWLYLPDEPEQPDPDKARVALPLDLPVAVVAGTPEQAVIEVRNEIQQRLSEQEAALSQPGTPVVTAGGSAASALAPSAPDVAATSPAQAATAEVATVTAPAVAAGSPERPAVAEPEPQRSTPAPVTVSSAEPASVSRSVAAVTGSAVKSEPKPALKPESKPEAPASAKRTTAANASRADELMGWPDRGYTLQVFGARSVASVNKFVAAQAQPQRFYYFETVYKNAPWHVVVYGQFGDRTAAMTAIESLPLELRKLRPWPRSISGVKADIQKMKR